MAVLALLAASFVCGAWPASAAVQPGDPASPTFRQLAADAGSPEPRVRRAAVRGLVQTGSPEALVPLGLLVVDPENDIQTKAIEGVVAIFVELPPNRRASSAEELFAIGEFYTLPWTTPAALVDSLLRALADDWPAVRRDAAYALGVVLRPPVDDRTTFELVQSLGDREPAVRRAAARSLGRLRARPAAEALVGGVNDETLSVRIASIRALGDLQESRALPALTEQFDFYYRGAVGRAAIDAIARIADPSSRSLLELHTPSRSEAHRRSAYEGLARLGVGGAAPQIEAAYAIERDASVSLAMAFALAAARRPFLQPIVDALGKRELTDQALGYLVELGSSGAGAVAAQIQHPDPLVRQRVAIALGFIGGDEGAEALNRALSDASADVRTAARMALARLRLPGQPPG